MRTIIGKYMLVVLSIFFVFGVEASAQHPGPMGLGAMSPSMMGHGMMILRMFLEMQIGWRLLYSIT